MWISVSVPSHINQKTVTVIIKKSQCCALYLCGIMHKTCFYLKLDRFVLKDDKYVIDIIMCSNSVQFCQLVSFAVFYVSFSS